MRQPDFVEWLDESDRWSMYDFTRDGFKTVFVGPAEGVEVDVPDAIDLGAKANDMGYQLQEYSHPIARFGQQS